MRTTIDYSADQSTVRSTRPTGLPSNRVSGTVPDHPPVPSFYGPTLLSLARRAIAKELRMPAEGSVDIQQSLRERGACYVTLTLDGALRGCIGSVDAWRSLKDDVSANARSAAFHDPRFTPLTCDEFDLIRIEVDVLSPPTRLIVHSDSSAQEALRPGIDGVILDAGHRRGTFLPQVWHRLPDPGEFLAHLKRKAGLSATEAWDADWRLSRYTVTSFAE